MRKLGALLALDRGRVRRRFEERFTASRMAADYVKLYKSLLPVPAERRALRLVSGRCGSAMIPQRSNSSCRCAADSQEQACATGDDLRRLTRGWLAGCPMPTTESQHRPRSRSRPSAVEAPFYIPATDAPSRPRRNLKHNDTFAVFDSHGDIGASAGGEDGLFDCDTRYLSHLELLINGSRPLLLHSAINDNNLNYLRRPHQPRHLHRRQDHAAQGYGPHLAHHLPVRGLLARAHRPDEPRRRAGQLQAVAGVCQRLRRHLRGARHQAQPPRPDLERGAASERRAACPTAAWTACVRQTTLHFEPAPTILQESVATYDVTLAPQEKRAIFVTAASRGRLPDPTAIVLPRPRRAQARAEGGDATCGVGRDVQLASSTRSCAGRWRTSTC